MTTATVKQTGTVKVSFLQRVSQTVMGFFSSKHREKTGHEITLEAKVVSLEKQLAQIRLERDSYRNESEQKQSEIVILRKEVEGMAKIITRHEKHWEAETAIESSRIAAATKGYLQTRSDYQ